MKPPKDHRFSVELVAWTSAATALERIRTEVFVDEQCVPIEIELDGLDPDCVHALAVSAAGDPIGTGRLLASGQIGRMAVLAAWRGRGVGAAILTALMDEARRRGMKSAYVHAQTRALEFYAAYGFVAEGEEYLEAGIPHVNMRVKL